MDVRINVRNNSKQYSVKYRVFRNTYFYNPLYCHSFNEKIYVVDDIFLGTFFRYVKCCDETWIRNI